mmetsp:Transcript_5368/g.18957  ORF Transcript_5368/g.18957 Transcript_5368/m.18957 type:complete len:204 (+) Transcript_5368:249-860(+)
MLQEGGMNKLCDHLDFSRAVQLNATLSVGEAVLQQHLLEQVESRQDIVVIFRVLVQSLHDGEQRRSLLLRQPSLLAEPAPVVRLSQHRLQAARERPEVQVEEDGGLGVALKVLEVELLNHEPAIPVTASAFHALPYWIASSAVPSRTNSVASVFFKSVQARQGGTGTLPSSGSSGSSSSAGLGGMGYGPRDLGMEGRLECSTA